MLSSPTLDLSFLLQNVTLKSFLVMMILQHNIIFHYLDKMFSPYRML